jgi:hypothetical protein
MPAFAYLENNIVTRMIVAPESPGGAAWVAATENCRCGLLWDGADFVEPPRHPDHATALAAAQADVRMASDAALARASENASPAEMATWPGKLAAAEAFDTGDTSAVILDRLADVGVPRGLDHAGAAELILAKASRFRAAAAAIEAARVSVLAALAAVETDQALAAYIAALDAVVAGIDWSG